MNNFNDLNEKELIDILERGNLSKKDFDKLIVAMKTKGMKGIISEVDPNDPAGKEMIEYVDFHHQLPPDYQSKTQIQKAQKFISQKATSKSDLKKLKTAIMILAHSGELKSLETLKNYAKNPHPKLQTWVKMAIDECQTFLESDLLDKPVVNVFPNIKLPTQQEIERKREELKIGINMLIIKYQIPITWEEILDIIYNETTGKELNKIVGFFVRAESIDQANQEIQLINDAWNYFPHKMLDDRCPIEMISEYQNKKSNN